MDVELIQPRELNLEERRALLLSRRCGHRGWLLLLAGVVTTMAALWLAVIAVELLQR